MPGKALIAGGSIGGLFAAAALRAAGWQVHVFERVGVELSGRGAGIVTHPELIAALEAVGADTADLGVQVTERVAVDHAGNHVARVTYPQVVTSWDRIHGLLRALIPEGQYHLGSSITGYQPAPDAVKAQLSDGRTEEADILIGADGFRSAIRAQMLPKVQPEYAGYVVWRALASESDLPAHVKTQVFDTFGMFLPTGMQIVGYPIAGPGNNLAPGQRRYNFVWYVPVPQETLGDMLTDADGQIHAFSIPPPLVRDDVLASMYAHARDTLPSVFLDILAQSERPFFTPIYDHHAPHMAQGRVALAGDAACVARPHVGMGVTKAAMDALALARHLDGPDECTGLAAYSTQRTPAALAAYNRARRLGDYMMQAPDNGHNRDGAHHPHTDAILRETAVTA